MLGEGASPSTRPGRLMPALGRGGSHGVVAPGFEFGKTHFLPFQRIWPSSLSRLHAAKVQVVEPLAQFIYPTLDLPRSEIFPGPHLERASGASETLRQFESPLFVEGFCARE